MPQFLPTVGYISVDRYQVFPDRRPGLPRSEAYDFNHSPTITNGHGNPLLGSLPAVDPTGGRMGYGIEASITT
jgi:hypothetical protein